MFMKRIPLMVLLVFFGLVAQAKMKSPNGKLTS